MQSQDTVERVRETISTIFNLPLADVPLDASTETIEPWDSMGHLLVILEIEQAFGVMLSPEQTERMTSIPAIVAELNGSG